MPATLTKPRQITYQRPWLYPKQYDVNFCPERYSITEASTKSGKTVGALVWLTEQAMAGKAGRNYWWVAPIYPQAKIAFRRLKRALPQEVYSANESELTIMLVNGAVIWFKGSEHPDALYGEDVWAAVIDEASRVKEESWHAVRTTLTATGGPIRIIGNVKGRRNWAYKLARRAESGEKDMSYHKITAHDAVEAGVIKADEVEDAKRLLPDSVFRELYLTEPSDDEGNPFGLTAIRTCISPLSNGEPIVFGIDLAKSVDYTVNIGLDRMGTVCRFERFQLPWQETMQRINDAVGKVRTIVDSTGVGDPILEWLQRSGRNVEGYHFSAPSKQQLMEGLAVAIQQHNVKFPDGIIVTELESFEYRYTRTGVQYSAMEGMHDDCVCALALAVHGTRPIPVEQERIVVFDAMSLVRMEDI